MYRIIEIYIFCFLVGQNVCFSLDWRDKVPVCLEWKWRGKMTLDSLWGGVQMSQEEVKKTARANFTLHVNNCSTICNFFISTIQSRIVENNFKRIFDFFIRNFSKPYPNSSNFANGKPSLQFYWSTKPSFFLY